MCMRYDGSEAVWIGADSQILLWDPKVIIIFFFVIIFMIIHPYYSDPKRGEYVNTTH